MSDSISLGGIILDEKSKEKLINVFRKKIPETWECLDNEIKINLGEINSKYEKDVGLKIALSAIRYAIDENVILIGFELFNQSENPYTILAKSNKNYYLCSEKIQNLNWLKIKRPIRLVGLVDKINLFNFEEYCIDFLKNIGYKCIKNENREDFSYYDLIDLNNNIKFECKYDKLAKTTNNFCIEVSCNGRLSGLLITKSDYWLISDSEFIYQITPLKIKECIIKNELESKKMYINQGNDMHKEIVAYLIPINQLKEYCERIVNLN